MSVREKLGLKELIAIGVGGMIGGGIFSVLGVAIGFSKSLAPLSFLIDMLIALSAGYHYAKLSLRFPSDGASYVFLKRAFPEHLWIANIEGWIVIVGYIGTLALYSFTFSAYISDILGLANNHLARIFFSVFIILFFFLVNLRGVRTAGITEDIVVYGKIGILLFLGLIGILRTSSGSQFAGFPEIHSVFLGSAVIFVAYEGFQLITNAVLESESPEKNIPRAIYASIVITGAIYILLAIVAVKFLSFEEIMKAKEYALAEVASPVLGSLGRVLVALGAILATSSAINSTLFGASRMMAEMASEGTMPKIFAKRTGKEVPYISLTILSFVSLAFAVLGGLDTIAEFSSMTFLLVSIGVSIANIKLRKETKANIYLAVLGLALMGITTLTIVIYLALNELTKLLSILAIYTVSSAFAVMFVRKS